MNEASLEDIALGLTEIKAVLGLVIHSLDDLGQHAVDSVGGCVRLITALDDRLLALIAGAEPL